MKVLKIVTLFLVVLFTMTAMVSCGDRDRSNPIESGESVTITNTFESLALTSGEEITIEELFGQPAGALAATSIVSDAIEFPSYLLGLYDIDINENSISFELVAQADDSTYMNFFRTLEAGTVDRYYLSFDEPHHVKKSSSSNSSVSLKMDSRKVLVVEIEEGFDFNPGTSFTIDLN